MSDIAVANISPAPDEMGPKLSACNERERRFVWAYLINGGNGAEAAREAGYSDASEGAKVQAHRLLSKDRILDALHEVAAKTLRGLSLVATLKAQKILEKDGHPDQARMILAIWSRTGFAEKTGIEVHHSGSVDLNHTDAAIEVLAWMKSMGVPREKLIEQFGHSGLARYERMLEERDARQSMKVIEHD